MSSGNDDSEIGERKFRELADSAPVMIWRARLDKECDWFNKRWLDYTGRPMEKELGSGWSTGVHPEDYERCVGTYMQAFDAREPFTMEYRLLRHDGQYRWLLDNGSPFQRQGEFAGYFGSCIDVTAYRLASDAQKMLIDELDHRVKNTLTIVQVLARQTFRSPDNATQLEAFEARIKALADTHRMLRQADDTTIDLRMMIGGMLPGWMDDRARYQIDGPSMGVYSQAAISLAIAFHELCTNAAHYGAFSNEAGNIDVRWEITAEPHPRWRLVWTEQDGPAVAEPVRGRGFGSRMLERVLASQIDGHVALVFDPQGLVCTIDAPLDRVGLAT